MVSLSSVKCFHSAAWASSRKRASGLRDAACFLPNLVILYSPATVIFAFSQQWEALSSGSNPFSTGSQTTIWKRRLHRRVDRRTISREVTFAKLCTGFAVLALLIACVGLYGTMSYNVARQVGEIGIRMALGAQRGAVVWMVLRRVLVLAAVGLAISVPAALSASQLVKSFLFETQPNDPGILVLAGVVLVSAAILAGYAPARRASRIDPLAALRHE